MARISSRNWVLKFFAGACLIGAAGCASAPPPRAELAQAQRAVDQAVTENSGEFAALELEKAREKLTAAQTEMDAERYPEARRLAEEALADAELARAKADASRTVRNADELAQTIERLREEAQARGSAPAAQ